MVQSSVTSSALLISVITLCMVLSSARYITDTNDRLVKRTMSDQRLAELQALIALSRGQGIPIGHGQIDPWRIGKRRKRDLQSYLDSDDTSRRLRLLDILLPDYDSDGRLS